MTYSSTGDALEARMRGTRFRSVRTYAEVASTNELLVAEARQGAPDGLVVVAQHQTAGRGRLDRRWEAPAGSSLLVSVLVRPDLEAQNRPLVLLAAAMAGRDAVARLAGLEVALKWPNDLVVGGRKLGGLLAESYEQAIVVGFGCNVAWGRMPAALAGIATSIDLEISQEPPPIDDLLVTWIHRLDARLGALESGRANDLVREASEVMTTIGADVVVARAEGDLVGRAVRLGPDGSLVVVDGTAQTHHVAVGDVVHLRHS